jgi:GMP reductase
MSFYKFINNHRAIDFKDTLIIPKKSRICSSKEVNLTKKITFKTKNKEITWEGVPIISSNNISDLNSFNELRKHNYISCFPKHFNKLWNENNPVYPSELIYTNNYMLTGGISYEDKSQMVRIISNLSANNIKVKFICIDVSNGYIQQMHDTCALFRDLYPDIVIVAGNVVTPECIYDLIKIYGVNIVKIGNCDCENRLKTGVGYPQLQAILDCSTAAHEAGGYIISDGGIKNPSDIAKAFAGGADFVMADSIFRCDDESPCKKIIILENTIIDINEGLHCACTYTNSSNLDEFYTNTHFINVS